MEDRGTTAANLQNQPIWVLDLLDLLAKISGKNLTGEQWAVQVHEYSQDQPIWVMDLLAWLAKISGKNLTGEQWAAQMRELLAELPTEGLPEEYWFKGKENNQVVDSAQEAEVKTLCLSDKDRAEIQEALENTTRIRQGSCPSICIFKNFTQIVAKIPPSETELLQQVLEAVPRVLLITKQSKDRKNYEDGLLRTLLSIAAKLTTAKPKLFQQTLEAAQLILNEDWRHEVLLAVAAQMPFSKCQSVLQQALESAQVFESSPHKSKALAVVAAYFVSKRETLLQQALDEAPAFIEEYLTIQALTAVAAQLPDSQLRSSLFQEALNEVKRYYSHDGYKNALAVVAAQVSISEVDLVLNVLKDNWHFRDNHQSTVFVALAAQIFASEPDLILDVLKNNWQFRDDHRSTVLVALVAQIPASEPDLLLRVLAEIKGIRSKDDRSKAFAAVAAQLPSSNHELLQKALEVAQSLNENIQNSVLAADRQSILQIAIQIALSLENKKTRIEAMSNIAFKSTEFLIHHLSQTHLSSALEIIPEGKSSADKAKLLSALAPSLLVGLFPRALQLIQFEITHPAYQAESLGNLAPYLSTEQLSVALDIVQNNIVGFSYSTTALCNLIPRLSLLQLQKALHIAATLIPIPHSALWTQVLQTTAKRLNAIVDIQTQADDLIIKNQLTQHILDHTHQKISDEKSIVTIIASLAASLNSDNTDQFAEILQDIISKIINSELYLAQALAAIAPKLSSEKIIDFFTLAESLRQECPIAIVLSAFISHYPDNLPASIVKLQQKLSKPIHNIDIAIFFATRPHPKSKAQFAQLTRDQTNVLSLIRELPCDVDRANYLVKLAPHLLTSQTLEVQSIALEIQDAYYKARSLLVLATYFPEIRAEAQRQIERVKNKKTTENEPNDKYLILYIELLSQFATTVPEQIPALLQTVEDWSKDNPFDDDGDLRTYKRHCILIALKPHLPIRLVREIERQTCISKAPKDLWERALFVLRNEYRQALKTGSLRNDATQDEDLLNLKDEINALTEMLLMRDLEPPVAVGILGGWGGGKSYIMHLMQTHMTEIRSQGMEAIECWGLAEDANNNESDKTPESEGDTSPNEENGQTAGNESPKTSNGENLKGSDRKVNGIPDDTRTHRYVGHIYQIKFDAWTYAKVDLWASLMQTIFFELDRQLTLETQLTEVLSRPPYDKQRQTIESKVWPVLYKSSDDEREWFLKQVLKDEKFLEELRKEQDSKGTTGILWKKFKESQAEATQSLEITEKALKSKREELEKAKSELKSQIRGKFEPIFTLAKGEKIQQIDALLGTSFILLRRRIGKKAFKDLNKEIYEQLFEKPLPSEEKPDDDSSPSENQTNKSSDQFKGLWGSLEHNLEKLDAARKKLEELEEKEQNSKVTPVQKMQEADLEKTKKQINDLLVEISKSKFDIFNVAANVIEKKQSFSGQRNCQWLKNNWVLVILFLVLFVAPLILLTWIGIDVWKNANVEITKILLKLATLFAPLLPGIAILQSLIRSGQQWFEETRLALHEYQVSAENRNKELETTYERSVKESLQADPRLRQLEQEIQELERVYAEQKQAAPLNHYASLSAFVSDRLDQGTYKNRLGLMQQVKQDLADLSNKLLPPSQYEKSFQAKIDTLKTVFPRGPARVFLYIDDLDRCPPKTVVEVLEAVQLLVKNPLFIAVLAIDERYINRALAQHYKGVLSLQGSPSAADYLEKIIQIPYRVRPIAEDELRAYLRTQTVIQDSETSGTKFNEFTPQEFNRLVTCCQEAELSPRSLKRLTNVYKLYKVLSRTRGHRPTPKEQQAILSLLVFSSRYPDLMRGILQEIGSHYEEGRHKMEEDCVTLSNVFKTYLSRHRNRNLDTYLAQDIQKLRHDVGKLIVPHDLKLKDMRQIFDFVRTFSFVGDIGVDSTTSTPPTGTLG